jgi:Flp pilus assembly protein TadG
MSLRTTLSRFLRNERGATAVEFVLIVPSLAMMTIGIINASLMVFTVATVHFATEDAARWCMINKSTCTSDTVNTYAVSRYAGVPVSPTFALTTPATCTGEQVTGTATYNFVTGVGNVSIPISATACRPFVNS